MSLQIVTVKEIEKERNRRYDTSDRRVLSRDLLLGYTQTSEIAPQEFQDCRYFYVARKWIGTALPQDLVVFAALVALD